VTVVHAVNASTTRRRVELCRYKHPLRDEDATDAEIAMTAWFSLAHSVFNAVLEVIEISHACFVHLVLQYSPTHFSQLDLNSANLEATVEAE